ncbi:MAG: hypothetical protein LBM18_06170 [Oscillospiraceae bacterium]|jgi:hypothetical protein|nr:hypothetical protein [Oscillospiraceae bacterium]
MDYLKDATSIYVDGAKLSFIRCDAEGNELSPEALAARGFTNSTIDSLVTQTAGRLGLFSEDDGSFSDGFITG